MNTAARQGRGTRLSAAGQMEYSILLCLIYRRLRTFEHYRKRFRDVNIYNSIVDSDVNRSTNLLKAFVHQWFYDILLTWVAGLCLVIVQMFKKPFRNPKTLPFLKMYVSPMWVFFHDCGADALMTMTRCLITAYWLPRLVAAAIFSFFYIISVLEKFGHNIN